jgi:hypothetical protein
MLQNNLNGKWRAMQAITFPVLTAVLSQCSSAKACIYTHALPPTYLWRPPWPTDGGCRPQENRYARSKNMKLELGLCTQRQVKSKGRDPQHYAREAWASVSHPMELLQSPISTLHAMRHTKLISGLVRIAIHLRERWDTANPIYTCWGLKTMPRSESSEKLVFSMMLPTFTIAKS